MKLLPFQTIVLKLALADQAETPEVHHHQGTRAREESSSTSSPPPLQPRLAGCTKAGQVRHLDDTSCVCHLCPWLGCPSPWSTTDLTLCGQPCYPGTVLVPPGAILVPPGAIRHPPGRGFSASLTLPILLQASTPAWG